MNSQSGSALQKANFVLLLILTSAVAYLIVRERIAAEDRRMSERRAAAAPEQPAIERATPTGLSPSEMRTNFAPLRSRPETNRPAPLPESPRRATVAPPLPRPVPAEPETFVRPSVLASPALPPPAVPVAFTSGSVGRGDDGVVVRGHVALRGTPPPEKRIALDPFCARLNPQPMFTRHYRVGRDHGLADVVVYIKSGAPQTELRDRATPLLDIVRCQFEPHVLAVQAGQPFTLRNSESVLLHVHADPRAPGNSRFNLAVPNRGWTATRSFETPEMFIRIRTSPQPWMFAYVSVFDHPWFAVTDQDGRFTIPFPLPPGQYTLAAMHLKTGEVVQELTISGGTPPVVNFTLDVPR